MFDAVPFAGAGRMQARDLALQTNTEFADLIATLRSIPRGELLKIGRQLDNLQRELAQPGLVDSRDLRVRIGAQFEEMSLLGSVVNRTRRRPCREGELKTSPFSAPGPWHRPRVSCGVSPPSPPMTKPSGSRNCPRYLDSRRRRSRSIGR